VTLIGRFWVTPEDADSSEFAVTGFDEALNDPMPDDVQFRFDFDAGVPSLRNKHRRSSNELDAFHAVSQTFQLVGRVGGEEEREKLAFPGGRPHHGTLPYGPVLHGKERFGESLARNRGCSFRRWSYAMMTTYTKRGALL
jgi:hypothetical protein